MKLSNTRIAVVLALFAVTWSAMQVSQTVKETPITQSLAKFPLGIGDWKFERKTFFDAPVINMLGVNDYISYDYTDRNGGLVNLYVSYFTAVGVTGGYHSPQNCLPGGGWNIASVDDVKLNRAGPFNGSEIKKVIVQKGGEQQVVLYWFQNRGRIIASEYWEKIYLVLDAVFKQRRDGSFIRIIGQVPKGADRAQFEKEMIDFAGRTVEEAARFIPGA